MKGYHRQILKSWYGTLILAVTLSPAALSYPLSRERAVPAPAAVNDSVQWEKFLIKGEPQPTLRIPAAHQHAATGCYGYLYVTRDEIRYEVISPAADSSHGFRYPRAALREARQWRFMGTTMPEVEFKFANGKTYHFFRVRERMVEQPDTIPKKFTWDDVLTWEPLAQAVTNFDEMVHLAEDRQRAMAPKPLPTVTLNVSPGTVEKGQTVTLTWASTNATSLDLEPGIGPVPAAGSRSVVPAESTTYILSAQGPGGVNNASGQVTVSAQQSPPTIVVIEPSVPVSGQTIDVRRSPLIIRGVTMDSSGIPVVTINGASAALRPKTAQAAEFTSDPITLQPGENRVEITAINTARVEAKLAFTARYTSPQTPAPRPTSRTNAKGLAKTEIIQLLKGDVPSARVASLVRERGVSFSPSDEDFRDIRAAGGGDDVVDAIKQSARQ